MDPQQISNLFHNTLEPSPETRGQAEAQLGQVFFVCLFLFFLDGFLPIYGFG